MFFLWSDGHTAEFHEVYDIAQKARKGRNVRFSRDTSFNFSALVMRRI